jgi:hypothetical protein
MTFYARSLRYFSNNPLLNSVAHAAAGFGLAIILQQYFQGDVFISPYIGWALIIFSVVVHARSAMK